MSVVRTMRYVNCIYYLCFFSNGHTNNHSQTMLLRFKSNLQSAYSLGICEETETWIECQLMATDEVHDHLSVIIDRSSL